MSIVDWLLNPSGLTPHGFCLSWAPGLVWIHAGSDAIIGLAYFMVPLSLALFARKRSDFEYSWILYLFVAFIAACGMTHFMSILTLWFPVYGIEGVIKLITALASVAAAFVLWPLVPKLLAIPSPAHLARLNSELAATVAEQRRTAALLAESESCVRTANLDLEQRVRDQTAEIRAAMTEAERANLAKSKFLATASHDLRQPVQSLTLLLSVVGRQVAGMPKAANTVEMAKASMASLNAMLTGMLDISRLDAGVVTPAFTSVDLGELVHRLALEYAPRAAADGLVLRHAPRALRARADAVLLERILRNLIENALRYTSKGGVLIGVRRRGDCVRLDVIDTGMGIAADHQTEIFEEFRQLNNPARDSSKGLGLGLAIVSRLARLLDIQIELASRLGRGTRFSLLLPLARTEAPFADVKLPAEGRGGRILIIEDTHDLRQVYELMLSDWGYEAISAATGEEALELAAKEKWRFDAILADQRLGAGLSGTETAREIACKADRTFPTLILTGDTAMERISEIEASGFIMRHKPVEADDLRQTLASLLRGDVKSSNLA
jgi:signal transduction histidine kinase/CheY-like chemotaxis protein